MPVLEHTDAILYNSLLIRYVFKPITLHTCVPSLSDLELCKVKREREERERERES